MTKVQKADERILEAVFETAKDLRRLGAIDQKKMLKYEAICLEAIPEYDSKKGQGLRKRYKLTQSTFASVLNTSLSTVRQWEIGEKHPSGPSKKLLNLLERKGLEVLI